VRRAFALFLVASLAGCASLPTSGPVTVGGPITVEGSADIEYLPTGPAEGASPREILDGFIAAGAAPQNNYRIARSFLTDASALSWNPARETVVRGVYAKVSTVSSSELSYSTFVEARVDENGVFQPAVAKKPTELRFSFAREAGEWRLQSPPDLTLVTEVAFESAYDDYTVYFFNNDRTAFVPDVRIFARQADPVTAVSRAVIAGPSEYLPNASTAFPDGSSLALAPVEVVSGRAIVDVSADVAQASLADQEDMLSLLGVSLGELPGVSSTTMSINQTPLPVSAIPGLEPNPRVDDRPLVVYDGQTGYVTSTEFEALEGIGMRIPDLQPTSVSYDSTLGVAAIGTRVGVYLVGQRTERVSNRPSLVDPQIDGSQSVWWVSPESPNQVSVFAGGRALTIGGPWSSRATVVGLEVSREGARVAVAVNDRGTGRLFVGSIEEDENGRPVGVSGYRSLAVVFDRIVDIAWADSTHIALIGTENSVAHAEVVTVGGRSTLLGQPQNPARISGGNTGVAGLVVIAKNGQLWRPRGSGWQSMGIPADVLATQR
jgi:hypothetical protein